MTQAELSREVAHATGETVSEIYRRGFGMADSEVVCFEPELVEMGQTVDWDAQEEERNTMLLAIDA